MTTPTPNKEPAMSTPNVSINVNIGTSEAVDALVHRYIEARQAELKAAEARVNEAERRLDHHLTDASDAMVADGRLAEVARVLEELPGISDVGAELSDSGGVTLIVQVRDNRDARGRRSLEIPTTLDGYVLVPGVMAEADALKQSLATLRAEAQLLRERIKSDGGPAVLRGEMLARLVEAQAPDLSATIASIVGGSRLLPERS